MNPLKTGSDEETTINWINRMVFKEKDINKILDEVAKGIKDFGPIRQNEMIKLDNIAKNKNLPLGMLISFRNILSSQKNIDAKKNISKNFHKIKDDYLNLIKENRLNIPAFFSKYKIPPLAILKILQNNNINVSKEFFNYAKNNDFENPEFFRKILFHSDKFEEILIGWIRKNFPKIKFKTQNELAKEQKEMYGRPLVTPDILFDEPILFKISNPDGSQYEQLVRWIDAKNYTLVNLPFIIQSITRQSEKYNNQFGPGALIFNYGFVDNIKVPNTAILSFN